jgi:hypothetical protein
MVFIPQVVCAGRAGMANAPIARLAANGFLYAAVNLSADGEVDIKCNGELAGKVFLELELGMGKIKVSVTSTPRSKSEHGIPSGCQRAP